MGLYLINLEKDFNKKTKMNSISQVFAIGDIHGCNSLLKKIHKKILNKSEKVKGNKILIYLGDYIDRGSNVRETIDTIINFKPRNFKCVFLRGNHDQMLLDFVNNKRNSLEMWLLRYYLFLVFLIPQILH